MAMSGWLELFMVTRTGQIVVTGSIAMTFRIDSTTATTNGTWTMQVTAEAGGAQGDGIFGVNIWMDFACAGGGCIVSGSLPRQVIRPFETRSGAGQYSTTVASPGDVGWANSLVNIGFSPIRPNGIADSLSISPLNAVRCDNALPGAYYVGCVFPDAAPTFTLSAAKWPASAAHVSDAQGSGLPGAIAPLHRLVDPDLQQRNRNAACPPRKTDPTDPTNPLPPLPTTSCDEYPFASTWEGAYLAGGLGRTFPWCGVTRLPVGVTGPGWSACMIPAWDNSGSGSDLGAFYKVNRVLSLDAFYVVVG
jgi:hypothetical protein